MHLFLNLVSWFVVSSRRSISLLFGKHSRKVWRSIIGALWTYPFRLVTLPAAIAATGLVDLSVIPATELFSGIAKGAALGMVLMVAQLLVNEYVVFEYLSRWFTGRKK
jgi:hypothetical protein